MRLYLMVGPLVLVALLQASGCTTGGGTGLPEPAAPGGTYISTSAGAFFDQAVTRSDAEAGEYIADFILQRGERTAHTPSRILVAAGSQGIVSSSDNGKSWKVITTPLAFTGDVVLLENGVLVATGSDAEGQGFILRSADEGKSWEISLTIPTPIKSGGSKLPGLSAKTVSSVVVSIAADPFSADKIYAGTSLGSVFVGEQSGKTWKSIHTLDTSFLGSASDRASAAITDIVPSPHNANELLLITQKKELWRLLDGEQEQIEIPRNLDPDPSPFATSGGERDIISATFVPGVVKGILVGVDDGAVVSNDNGGTWKRLSVPVDAAEDYTAVAVTVSPTNPSRLLVGINSVVYRSEDGGESWNTFSLRLPSHIITQLLIDPSNAANVIAVTTPIKS